MFFTNLIKIPDVKSRLIRSRTQLLKDIVKGCAINLPFQNVTAFGVPKPGPKSTPSFKSLLDSTIRGHGGMCAHNNYSLKLILENLGYQTYTLGAKFRRTLVEGSHLVLLVKIKAPYSLDQVTDDVYIVDAGCGVPLYEPIRLKDLPYRSRAGGVDFSYELSSDGKIANRIHIGGDAIVGKKPVDYLCPQDYTIHLNPVPVTTLVPNWGQLFHQPKTSAFHSTFYLFRYLYINEDDSDFKIVCIRGKELVFITKEFRTAQLFSSFQDLMPVIKEYFPMLIPDEVNVAISHFSKIETGELTL